MKRTFAFILFCGLCLLTYAQDKSAYQKLELVNGADTLPYRILLPLNYDATKAYPLILFLHGSGERGNNNEAQLTHGWKLFLLDSIRKGYPAIVVFPQCAANSSWSQVEARYDTLTKQRNLIFPEKSGPTKAMSLLLQLVKELDTKYKLDKERWYVGGLSMGGMGTFELVRRQPKKFAAAFPICGGGNTAWAKKMKYTAWWIFHGLKDEVVAPLLSQQMAAALQERGAQTKLTLYPTATHNSWDAAFAEADLFPWLFSQKR